MFSGILHALSYTLRTKINPYPEVRVLLPTTQPTSTFCKKELKCCVCVSLGEALSGWAVGVTGLQMARAALSCGNSTGGRGFRNFCNYRSFNLIHWKGLSLKPFMIISLFRANTKLWVRKLFSEHILFFWIEIQANIARVQSRTELVLL